MQESTPASKTALRGHLLTLLRPAPAFGPPPAPGLASARTSGPNAAPALARGSASAPDLADAPGPAPTGKRDPTSAVSPGPAPIAAPGHAPAPAFAPPPHRSPQPCTILVFCSTLALYPVSVSRFGCVPPISPPPPPVLLLPQISHLHLHLASPPLTGPPAHFFLYRPFLLVRILPAYGILDLARPAPRLGPSARPAPPRPPLSLSPRVSHPELASRFAFAPSSSTCPLSAIFSPWTWTSCSSRAYALPRPLLETLPFDLSWPCPCLHSMTGLSPFRLTPSAHHPFPRSGPNGLHARPLLAPPLLGSLLLAGPFLRISRLRAVPLLSSLSLPLPLRPNGWHQAPPFSPHPEVPVISVKPANRHLAAPAPLGFARTLLNRPPPREARAGPSPRQRACNRLAAATGQQRVLETKVVIPTRASTQSGFYIKNATPKKSLVSL